MAGKRGVERQATQVLSVRFTPKEYLELTRHPLYAKLGMSRLVRAVLQVHYAEEVEQWMKRCRYRNRFEIKLDSLPKGTRLSAAEVKRRKVIQVAVVTPVAEWKCWKWVADQKSISLRQLVRDAIAANPDVSLVFPSLSVASSSC